MGRVFRLASSRVTLPVHADWSALLWLGLWSNKLEFRLNFSTKVALGPSPLGAAPAKDQCERVGRLVAFGNTEVAAPCDPWLPRPRPAAARGRARRPPSPL